MTTTLDHPEDHPGRAGVRAVEPRRPLPAGRRLPSRRIANVTIPTSTPTANRSSRNPIAGQRPMPGMWKSRSNSPPQASMIVRVRTMKPRR